MAQLSITRHRAFFPTLICVCVLLSAAFGKPLWIDEVLQFAIGSFSSMRDAWTAFVPTTAGLNHGQTGAYFMADYVLLHLFGASAFWTRFPSFAAGFLLFFAARHLFVQWKLSPAWQVWGILALFSQKLVSDYIGEGRPYIVLAACTVGMLAYYSTPESNRRYSTVRVLGWVSALFGSLFHPYFPVYWVFLAMLTFAQKRADGERQKWLRSFIRHCNPAMVAAGAAVYFAIAIPGWLSHKVGYFNFDPFYWLPKQFSFPRYLYATHFLFLRMFKIPLTGVFLLSLPLVARKRRKLVFFALAILVGSLAISGFLSYLSYRVHYWIIERQWIASCALTVMGVTWFLATMTDELKERLGPKRKEYVTAWIALTHLLVTLNCAILAHERILRMQDWASGDQSALKAYSKNTPPPKDGNGWEALARANAAQGGVVWPAFREHFR